MSHICAGPSSSRFNAILADSSFREVVLLHFQSARLTTSRALLLANRRPPTGEPSADQLQYPATVMCRATSHTLPYRPFDNSLWATLRGKGGGGMVEREWENRDEG